MVFIYKFRPTSLSAVSAASIAASIATILARHL